MVQPKLKVISKDLVKKYGDLLTIPEGEVASKTIIGIIGDAYKSRSGKSTLVPVVLLQSRKDISRNSKKVTEVEKFFLGYKEWDRVLRHTQNMSYKVLQEMGLQEGQIIEGANLAVDYGFDPFWERNGVEQEPLLNPETDQIVTSGGKPLYRNTRVEFGPAIHTGLDIPRDVQELEEVSESISLDEYSEDDF